jgi:Ca-activated chloride channel homolog
MAYRPTRSQCAPRPRWGRRLLILGLFLTALGCSQREDPPAIGVPERTDATVIPQSDEMPAERNADAEGQSARTAAAASAEEKTEGANKFVDDLAHKSKGAVPGKSGPGIDGYTSNPRFLSRQLLTGANGMFGTSPPSQVNGFGGNNVGNLFQGGAGALGFGGGNAGMFGFQGGRQAADTPDVSAERYQHFEDNPFKAVRGEDALFTISTAVDTAAYANARARITEGQLPTKDAVRIADFVNYFPYGYAAPTNGDPVAFKLELAPCPWQAGHHLLRVGLKARVIDKDQMPARNLVFLIDTSGSMNAPNRLPLVQESLKLLVEQLTGRDRVSIVTYAGTAGLLLPPTPGDQKDRIKEEINNLSAEGSTNGEGGIKVAYEQAEKTFIKDGINRVILATDGDFNVGVSDDAQLVRLIEGKRKTGVYLTVLGYGMGNLQDATLEQLAHHGNGHYAYIDSYDEARKVFVEQGAALVTVAKDVKLQVEFNPAKVAGYRLIGYENRVLRAEDFRNDAKDAGDMGSGHTCTALYEIVPVGEKVPAFEVEPLKYQSRTELTDAAKTGEWLTVRMRYKHPETDKASEVSAVVPTDGLAKAASADFRFAAAAAAFGMLLRDSEYRGTADYAKVVEWAKPAIGEDKGGHRAEFVRVVEKAKEIAQKIPNE